jgi:O-acetyl-ADP-ribose deacetylase (regulator of RNase III)
MAVILRIESDMFVFADVCDALVNPVNLVGVSGAGIAAEFRARAPDHIEIYREACRTKELRMGTIKIIDTNDLPYQIWCVPTKDHFANPSSLTDIARSLEALRETLTTDRYKYTALGIPMLGTGCGKADYENVLPLMLNHLDDLEATIFLSLAPQRTEMRPKYLVIVGPPDYGLTLTDKEKINEIIDKSMNHWGVNLSDYEGIVSGGYKGVDEYVCGLQYRKDIEDTYVFKKTGKTPIVIQPNKVNNGVGSVLKHHHLLCEIGHDFIFFKPEGFNNNRMSLMQRWIKNDKEKRANDGHPPRRTAVYGVTDTALIQDQILL